jgi:hypothetical protein
VEIKKTRVEKPMSFTVSAVILRIRPRLLAVVALAASLAANAAMSSMAHAQIVSAKARYDRGILSVRGRTAAPLQYVSLNRFFVTRSNRRGRFVFRQTRLPASCAVTLRSEDQQLRVPVKNCGLAFLSSDQKE